MGLPVVMSRFLSNDERRFCNLLFAKVRSCGSVTEPGVVILVSNICFEKVSSLANMQAGRYAVSSL